jgi:propionyl-CoA synthetase
MLDEAIDRASEKPAHCLVLQRPQCEAGLTAGRDRDWAETVAAAS